jgi:hypothetical protein
MALATSCVDESRTPFGWPVEPEVKMILRASLAGSLLDNAVAPSPVVINPKLLARSAEMGSLTA